jgi:hypothetical protein
MPNYLMKVIVSCFLCLIARGVYSQNFEQYNFNVHRYADSVRIESCNPYSIYNSRLQLPINSFEKKQIMNEIPMHVIGSKWINDCLIINWSNIPNEDILGYIKEFTNLREDQIILSE